MKQIAQSAQTDPRFDPARSRDLLHPWHDLEPSEKVPEEFYAVIEIPLGANVKYELDKPSGVPKVSKRKQHRPTAHTLRRRDDVHRGQREGQVPNGAALLAGCDARISELLALRIEKHISDDRSTLFMRQQRGKKGGVKLTLKTDAGFRDIDVHPALAKMLSDCIGDRKEGFLFQTRKRKHALSSEFLPQRIEDNLQEGGKNPRSNSTRFADFVNRCCSGQNAVKSRSTIGWGTKTRT
jgi:hypothetical protein